MCCEGVDLAKNALNADYFEMAIPVNKAEVKAFI